VCYNGVWFIFKVQLKIIKISVLLVVGYVGHRQHSQTFYKIKRVWDPNFGLKMSGNIIP
jgi:hypothetical protein